MSDRAIWESLGEWIMGDLLSQNNSRSEDAMSASSDNTAIEFITVESDECYSCGGEAEDEKCEHSERDCGHHCNHYVDGDGCCFCGALPAEEE